MIKYLGSKRLLLSTISDVISEIPNVRSVIDLFSGTSRVGHHLKGLGYCVHSNDLNQYAYALATCYVAADKEKYEHVEELLKEMSALPSKEGYFTETFCRQSMFFQPHNGMRVDAMRDWIEEQDFDWTTKAILLVSNCAMMSYLVVHSSKGWIIRNHCRPQRLLGISSDPTENLKVRS